MMRDVFLSDREATDLAGALLERFPLAEEIVEVLEDAPPALTELLAQLGELTALAPSPAASPQQAILHDLQCEPTTSVALRELLPRVRSDVLHLDSATAPWVVLALIALANQISLEVEYDGDRRTLRLRIVAGREEALMARLRRWFAATDATPQDAGPASAFARLSNLFDALFTPAELRRFVHTLPDGERLAQRLPEYATPTVLSGEVTALLVRAGNVDESLFTALRAFAPGRANDIDRVQAMWRAADAPPRP